MKNTSLATQVEIFGLHLHLIINVVLGRQFPEAKRILFIIEQVLRAHRLLLLLLVLIPQLIDSLG